jgi:hypothetical protein
MESGRNGSSSDSKRRKQMAANKVQDVEIRLGNQDPHIVTVSNKEMRKIQKNINRDPDEHFLTITDVSGHGHVFAKNHIVAMVAR